MPAAPPHLSQGGAAARAKGESVELAQRASKMGADVTRYGDDPMAALGALLEEDVAMVSRYAGKAG